MRCGDDDHGVCWILLYAPFKNTVHREYWIKQIVQYSHWSIYICEFLRCLVMMVLCISLFEDPLLNMYTHVSPLNGFLFNKPSFIVKREQTLNFEVSFKNKFQVPLRSELNSNEFTPDLFLGSPCLLRPLSSPFKFHKMNHSIQIVFLSASSAHSGRRRSYRWCGCCLMKWLKPEPDSGQCR